MNPSVNPDRDLPSDDQLVARCVAGEESAWELLVGRYADLVHATARRSGCTAEEAADVVQEVFLALLRSLSRLRRRERLVGWILTSARRESWRQVRRRRQAARREQQDPRPGPEAEPLPPEAITALEEEQAVREAYRALPERCRRLLDALFFAGERKPYVEIAEDLGIAVGSIGPTRARCLAGLRRELVRLGFEWPSDVSGGDAAPRSR